MSEERASLFAARFRAAWTLLLYVLLAPVFVLWFGLPILWGEYPSDLRNHARTAIRGL